jgi:hypothetical protein
MHGLNQIVALNAEKKSSYEGRLPSREPQAPRSIPVSEADKDSASGRNNQPYNKGGEPHTGGCGCPPGAK